MKKIKTFESACKKLGIDSGKLPDVSMLPEKHQKALIAHYKLVIIAESLNNGWQPNWKDDDEYKYVPWFDLSAASGFAYDGYDSWYSDTGIGSRLCYKSRELAEYAGKTFLELYKEYFII